MRRFYISTALIAFLFASVIFSCSGGETYVQDGVYTFTFSDLDGNPKNFADLRGKGVVVNFWATWCGPCKDEIPVFIKLYEKYKDKNFEFWGVSADIEGKKVVEPYAKDVGINYPLLLTSQSEIVKIFSARKGLPLTIFFDKNGREVNRIQGPPMVDESKGETMESVFENYIKKILPD